MAAPSPRERHAHRPRWRPVPDPRSASLPGGSTARAADRQIPRQGRMLPQTDKPGRNMSVIDLASLGLPQLFSPRQAAEILRSLGLAEITETALRSRAYRRQIPFHLNGRKITFTASDLREIAEGQARRPEAPAATQPKPPTPPTSRRTSRLAAGQPQGTWRARPPSSKSLPTGDTPR
jgi:hypothetical protein